MIPLHTANILMKILIVQTGFIGDLVLSLAVIDRVRSSFPGAELVVMVTPIGAELLRGDKRIDDLIIYDKRGADSGWAGLRRMAANLKARAFTHSLALHKSFRTTLLLYLSGIQNRVGFCESSLNFLHTVRVSRSHYPHEVMRNFCIIQGLGLEVATDAANIALQIVGSDESKPPRTADRITLAPGSVWRTKRWSSSGFTELSKQLLERGKELVFIGGAADAPIAEKICAALPTGARVKNLVGKLSLMESAREIASSSLLVSNDTAPLHLASATGTPAVAVFCATIPAFGFTPWKIPHRIVGRNDLSCRPCGRHGGDECPTGTHLCRRGVAAGAVMAAVEDLLTESGVGGG